MKIELKTCIIPLMPDSFDELNGELQPVDSGGPEAPAYPCFRCGQCCRLRVFLTYEEAERITEATNLSLEDFATVYWARSIDSQEFMVLKEENGACLFLRDGGNPREKTCVIYESRPDVCREFVPSYLRKECQDGLIRFWNLKTTPSGRLEGDEERVKAFEVFLRNVTFGEKPK